MVNFVLSVCRLYKILGNVHRECKVEINKRTKNRWNVKDSTELCKILSELVLVLTTHSLCLILLYFPSCDVTGWLVIKKIHLRVYCHNIRSPDFIWANKLSIWHRGILQHPRPWTHHTIAEIRIDKWMTPNSRLIIQYLNNTFEKISRIIPHVNEHGKAIFPSFSSSWCPHFIVDLCNWIMRRNRSSKELIIHLPIFVVIDSTAEWNQSESNLPLYVAID